MRYTSGDWVAAEGNWGIIKSERGELVASEINNPADVLLIVNAKKLLNALEEVLAEFDYHVEPDFGKEDPSGEVVIKKAKRLVELLK